MLSKFAAFSWRFRHWSGWMLRVRLDWISGKPDAIYRVRFTFARVPMAFTGWQRLRGRAGRGIADEYRYSQRHPRVG